MVQRSVKQTIHEIYKMKLKSENQCPDTVMEIKFNFVACTIRIF